MKGPRLAAECEQAMQRARSLRVRDLRYTVTGDSVLLEGEVLAAEGLDSIVKIFRTTSAREVVSRMVLSGEASQPGGLKTPGGYVHVVELGPHASRLVETGIWEVAKGDTLASISTAVYGDPAHAEQIARANASQVAAGGFVRPGQKLRLPAR